MAYFCVVCNAELERVDMIAVCTFCGHQTPTQYLCPAGHHICEDCQLADWPDVVERVCDGSHETDPSLIVNLIMKHPMSAMHSPQPAASHHAYRGNAGRPAKQWAGPAQTWPAKFGD